MRGSVQFYDRRKFQIRIFMQVGNHLHIFIGNDVILLSDLIGNDLQILIMQFQNRTKMFALARYSRPDRIL